VRGEKWLRAPSPLYSGQEVSPGSGKSKKPVRIRKIPDRIIGIDFIENTLS
jgi:hypothetical protein